MARRVLFYVQHLWGIGHVYRASRVARGLADEGFEVHLVWGGTEIPGFDFLQLCCHRLTPVRTGDVSFSKLLHADGREFTDQDAAARRDQLLALYQEIDPDIVMTEAFPFGRRQMRFELLPLLETAAAARKRPMIVASIRDIMQENRKAARVQESVDYVRRWYDLILVHGDPALVPITATLQGVEQFAEKIRYTGLVTPEPEFQEPGNVPECNILVSVGGGAFGRELAEVAVDAARLSGDRFGKWLILAGSQMPDKDYKELQKRAGNSVTLKRSVPDLKSAMRYADISVSHAGYNTVGDLLRSGCRAVLYPYTAGRESEQLHRSRLMQAAGMTTMIEPDTLSAEVLLRKLVEAGSMQREELKIDLEGARNTARILGDELENHFG